MIASIASSVGCTCVWVGLGTCECVAECSALLGLCLCLRVGAGASAETAKTVLAVVVGGIVAVGAVVMVVAVGVRHLWEKGLDSSADRKC